jgi:acyl-CoA synthetase (AMP-forming)/AMP-acid ligase II
MFQVLFEAEVQANPALLSDAWNSDSSFILLPTPAPVTEEWLSEALVMIPAEFAQGHFGILTSGSTGTPKLVIGSKGRTTRLARQIHARQELESVETAIVTLPLSYSYSLVNQWIWAHLHERRIVQTRGLADPATLLATFEEAKSSMICMVGSMLPVLRRYVPANRSFPNVIRLNFAGGPFPQAEMEWLQQVFPNTGIYHNYGCTEALPRLTIRRADESADAMELGAPVEGAEFHVDEDGMLLFRSPYSASLVLDVESATRIDPSDWVSTGDRAEFLPNGRVRLLGRKSEVFKRHGEKISLSSLGESIRGIWNKGLAFYTETAADGETGHVLVLAPDADQASARTILLHLRQHYRRPFWPIRIENAETIPLSGNGKPDLAALKEQPRTLLWKQIL